jgi:cytochrome P450 family 144
MTEVVNQTLDATLLLDAEVIDDPYPFYRRLLAEAPAWRVPGTAVVAISSFELINDAVGRVEDFSSNMKCLLYKNAVGLPEQLSFGDIGQQTLATADPPEHALHRKTVFPDLVAKRMVSLEPFISDLATICVRNAVAEQTTDFMATVGNVVPITVVNDLVGFQGSDPTALLHAAFDSTAMLGAVLPLTELDALITRIGKVQHWIVTQLQSVDTGLDGHLLGTIARGVSAGTFGEYEATVMLHTLLSAGGETTSSLLGNAVRILAERPDLQDQLRSDPSLVPSFAEEVLRLESPFRVMLRSVPADTTIGGVDVRAGDTVLLLFGAANRDPQQWERPDYLDLYRDMARTHLAFGKGIHYCVGARLARLEADIVLRELLARTSSIELDPERPPRIVQSLLVRRLAQLPLRLTSAS